MMMMMMIRIRMTIWAESWWQLRQWWAQWWFTTFVQQPDVSNLCDCGRGPRPKHLEQLSGGVRLKNLSRPFNRKNYFRIDRICLLDHGSKQYTVSVEYQWSCCCCFRCFYCCCSCCCSKSRKFCNRKWQYPDSVQTMTLFDNAKSWMM